MKCVKSLSFPVVGFVPTKGKSLAAIRLARREGDKLLYAGKAGKRAKFKEEAALWREIAHDIAREDRNDLRLRNL